MKRPAYTATGINLNSYYAALSGATCEFIYARARGGGRGGEGVTNPDERVAEEKEHADGGQNAKGAKKARAKGR